MIDHKYFLTKVADIAFLDKNNEIVFEKKNMVIEKDENGEYFVMYMEDVGLKKFYLNK